MICTARATSYNEIPYADDPYPSSHPGHLAAVATLAGLSPPPVESCRVLELGCAGAGNLIPMAVSLPGSRFVGIDSSFDQIDSAREIINALNLDNIAIQQRDIREIGADFGQFDYIICHGIYSWVTGEVQDKILEISSRNLSPNGIVYISYNTHPGWKQRGLVRDLMCYRTRRSEGAEDRAEQARQVLDFMASSAASFDQTYATWLGEEAEYIRRRSNSYLLHDHLEEVNDPVYFDQLAGRAASKKLRYVSEVQNSVLALESFPKAVVEGLRELAADEVEFEQFLDFLVNRKFRQSVFCHAAITPWRAPNLPNLSKLQVFSSRSVSLPPIPFRNEWLLRDALHELAASRPRSVSWEALTSKTLARFEGSAKSNPTGLDDNNEQDLASDLVCCYKLKLVEFRTDRDAFVLEMSEKPIASPLARLQARLGSCVTNLRHEAGRLNEFSRFVLRHLDGKHDRTAILLALDRARLEGVLDIPGLAFPIKDGNPDSAPEKPLQDTLGSMLDRCLEKFARFALISS